MVSLLIGMCNRYYLCYTVMLSPLLSMSYRVVIYTASVVFSYILYVVYLFFYSTRQWGV
jgi:hypothetical protein